MTYAIVRDEDGSVLKLVGPVANRNEIKVALRPWKAPGAVAVVINSLRARTGTLYTVFGTDRHGRATYGSGTWLRGEQIALSAAERALLASQS